MSARSKGETTRKMRENETKPNRIAVSILIVGRALEDCADPIKL